MAVTATPERDHGGLVVALACALTTAAILFVGYVISVAVSFGRSVCSDDPVTIATQQHALRTDLLIAWTALAVFPAVVTVLVRGWRRWAWGAVTAVPLVIGVALAVSARPSTWCAF